MARVRQPLSGASWGLWCRAKARLSLREQNWLAEKAMQLHAAALNWYQSIEASSTCSASLKTSRSQTERIAHGAYLIFTPCFHDLKNVVAILVMRYPEESSRCWPSHEP